MGNFADKVQDKYQDSSNKGFLIAAAVFVFIGLIISAFTTHNLQHPVIHWVVLILLALGYLWVAYLFANDKIHNSPVGKFAVATAIFFIVGYGIGANAGTNRAQGIPAEAVITANGHIPNPEKFIAFHETVETRNKIELDEETKAFIRANNKLPDWVVIGGYTRDPIGWQKAHNGKPAPKQPSNN